MKRNIVLLGLALALVGCRDNGAQVPPQVASDTATASTVSQPAAAEPASTATQPANAGNAPVQLASKADASRKGSTLCNIEYLDKEKFSKDLVRQNTDVTVVGWLGDEVTRGAPAQPALRFVNADNKSQRWELPLALGLSRKDVANRRNEAGLAATGFRQQVSLQSMPKGRYHIYLTYTSNGTFYTCDNGRHLVIQ